MLILAIKLTFILFLTFRSPFLYMALLGLPELPGTLIITPLGGKFGRKRVGFVCAIITANLLAAMALLKGLQVQREWILVAMAIVAYVALVGVSQMTILLTAELFPTTVRSLGSSFGFFMNNVGYCIPPLLELFLVSLSLSFYCNNLYPNNTPIYLYTYKSLILIDWLIDWMIAWGRAYESWIRNGYSNLS